MGKNKFISIVTPALNEAGSLPRLHAEIANLFSKKSQDFEWVIVDDYPSDQTFNIIQQLSSKDSRVRDVRLSRNFESRWHYCAASTLRQVMH